MSVDIITKIVKECQFELVEIRHEGTCTKEQTNLYYRRDICLLIRKPAATNEKA